MDSKLLNRIADKNLLEKVAANNLTIIGGASHTGRTALTQKNLPDWRYVSLHNPYDRMNATNDPEEYLEWLGDKVIIDDIQYNIPFAKMIYKRFQSGNLKQKVVLITNNHLGKMMEDISIVVPVLGLSNAELLRSNIRVPSANPWIIKGSNPELLLSTLNPHNYFQDYITNAVESLQAMQLVHKPANFVRLLKMLAARVGTPIIVEELGELCDVSIPTIKVWLRLLEQYFIISNWLPYHNNYGKRISKKTICYFSSTGIVSTLLNIRDTEDLEYSPYKQSLFTNAVVGDILRKYYSSGEVLQPYYWQEQNRNNIDLIFDTADGTKLWKVVYHSSVKPTHTRCLERFAKISGVPKENMTVIYNGKELQTINGFKCVPWNMM